VRDKKTGRFYPTHTEEIYRAGISEFHDVITRRTFEEMMKAGVKLEGNISVEDMRDFGMGNNRGFRIPLRQLEFQPNLIQSQCREGGGDKLSAG
jgi:hypothetical protein